MMYGLADSLMFSQLEMIISSGILQRYRTFITVWALLCFVLFFVFFWGGGDTHMFGIPYTFKMNVSVFFNFMPNKCNRQVCDS